MSKKQEKEKEPDFIPINKEIKEAANEMKDEPTEFINESIMSVNWKLKILMFLIFMLVCSTMFINEVVGRLGPDMIRDQYSTTNRGTVVQGVLFVLIYGMLEMCTKSRVI